MLADSCAWLLPLLICVQALAGEAERLRQVEAALEAARAESEELRAAAASGEGESFILVIGH